MKEYHNEQEIRKDIKEKAIIIYKCKKEIKKLKKMIKERKKYALS